MYSSYKLVILVQWEFSMGGATLHDVTDTKKLTKCPKLQRTTTFLFLITLPSQVSLKSKALNSPAFSSSFISNHKYTLQTTIILFLNISKPTVLSWCWRSFNSRKDTAGNATFAQVSQRSRPPGSPPGIWPFYNTSGLTAPRRAVGRGQT